MTATIELTDAQVAGVLSHLRGEGGAEYRFDINLAEGKMVENSVATLLGSKSFEVKRDFKAAKTGNIAVEYECRGKPSGIAVTEAEWWVYDLGNSYLFMRTDELKKLAREHYSNRVEGGDPGSGTKMVLIPVSRLLR